MEINYEKILNSLSCPVAVFDEDDRLVSANPAFFKHFPNLSGNITLKTIKSALPNTPINIEKSDNLQILTFCGPSENMEAAYTEFVSTVSHELRTPLTSIRGFAQTMISSYDRLETAQILKFLGIIKDQSNRLIKLVENLLSISKMQSQKENFVYKSLNINDLLAQILPILQKQYPSHKFSTEITRTTPLILADEDKLQQILINLIDNAAKYSPQGSTVQILTAGSGNSAHIEIKDQGAGIAPEDFDKIFEKFTRIENHLTQKTEGSGLGLYIVKNLVEKMGGKITLTSSTTPPAGTKFTLELPAADYAAQSGKKLKENQ